MYWQAIQTKLTCPFHILAYKIEIKHRAAMGDELVHPELKRGPWCRGGTWEKYKKQEVKKKRIARKIARKEEPPCAR